ncbi:MAG: poly-gamma-glutamate system protein [Bacteroidia bacterium]|nr:poly-gamma-glutamate system protein [Bacteroidia bacterium]
MNRISIRSTHILSILGTLAIACLLIVENTKVESRQDWYSDKLEASRLSSAAHGYIKDLRFKNGIFIDNINDPNETGLIGQEFSPISSGRGSLSIKSSTVNPNFAALVLELLKDAGVEKGDNVAICMTGSFPALNMSTIAALQTLEANPIVISSVTSSTWGATDPDFTWLDMHNMLHSKGVFKHKAVAASIGGNQDIGRALSAEGRELALQAIDRNGLIPIVGANLEENVARRMEIFQSHALSKPIKLYINVGGGVASLGSKRNGFALKAGLNEDVLLASLPDKKGVVFQMAQMKVPIIHLLHLNVLMNKFNIPYEPMPIPKVGTGDLYHTLKYDLVITGICLVVLTSLIGGIVYQDKKRNELGSEIIQTKRK